LGQRLGALFLDGRSLRRIVAIDEVCGQRVDLGLKGVRERRIVVEGLARLLHRIGPILLVLRRVGRRRVFRRLVVLGFLVLGLGVLTRLVVLRVLGRSIGSRRRRRWRIGLGHGAEVLVGVHLRGLRDGLAPFGFLLGDVAEALSANDCG